MNNSEVAMIKLNPAYAQQHIAQALQTYTTHPNADTRARAEQKVGQWRCVLRAMRLQTINYGSRTPVGQFPEWVTLDVIQGGFATGTARAGGELLLHEVDWVLQLGLEQEKRQRLALNSYFLSEAGLAQLYAWLDQGDYSVSVPEEGALLSIAWLVRQGDHTTAHAILDTITPYFNKLRFYPQPRKTPQNLQSVVYLRSVRELQQLLRETPPHHRLLAQKEASQVWAPLHDEVVALMLETEQAGQFCQRMTQDWLQRAQALLDRYETLRERYTLCSKHRDRRKGYQRILRELLADCVAAPKRMQRHRRAQAAIQKIVNAYIAKRGAPGSERQVQARALQQQSCQQPLKQQLAQVLAERLAGLDADGGLDEGEKAVLLQPVQAAEAQRYDLPLAYAFPDSLARQFEYSLNQPLGDLLRNGALSSCESLARVLPQITSHYLATSMVDPAARILYAALYRAFRARRSLLLLNLERQVQLQEVPWIDALMHRGEAAERKKVAMRQALLQVCRTALTYFPYTILPNKLLQEMRALANHIGLNLPLVEELAVDIFMSKFSPKFTQATLQAADLMQDTLYARYYGIDYVALRDALSILPPNDTSKLASVCGQRLKSLKGSKHLPATVHNGRLIEQQQILSTHNLATLWLDLDLGAELAEDLQAMARHCLRWLVAEKRRASAGHVDLLRHKNAAYAWRQMVFFLSFLPQETQQAFVTWVQEQVDAKLPRAVRLELASHVRVLQQAVAGRPIEVKDTFLGWVGDA